MMGARPAGPPRPELLEATDLDVDRVVRRAGFGTAANLREHFRRELATTPTAYRRTFLCASACDGPDRLTA
jgi:transcriptional regulator GlxA family with amidase domain